MNLDKNTKYILIGLGNPGDEYKETYHNIGRMCVEKMIEINHVEKMHATEKTFTASKKENMLFVTTNVFMNESGIAVKKALAYLKTEVKSLIVIHDEADIELGSFKMSFRKGNSGHKGVLSIINTLHTNAFWRIRIGIAKKMEGKKIKAGDYVLKKITKKDQLKVSKVFTEISENLQL